MSLMSKQETRSICVLFRIMPYCLVKNVFIGSTRDIGWIIHLGGVAMIDETNFHIGMKRLEKLAQSSRRDSDKVSNERKINVCNICGHRWKACLNHPHPRVCPKCRSSYWDHDDIKHYECFRCGHKWLSARVPVRCPSCRSRTWGTRRLNVRCKVCGAHWKDPVWVDGKMQCPECGNDDRDGIIISPSKMGEHGILSRNSTLNEDLIKGMRSANGPYFKTVFLVRNGLSSEHAGILVRLDGGSSATSIASEMALPVADVMTVVSAYIDLFQTEGA